MLKKFKNISLEILFLLGKIKYPKILPKSKFKYIDIDSLNNANDDIVIVRRSLVPSLEGTFTQTGTVKAEAIYGRLDDLKSLSMNLLGGEFDVDDIKWRQYDFASSEWNYEKTIFYHQVHDSISLHEGKIPILYYLKNLQEFKFPFRRNFNPKENQKQIPQKLDPTAVFLEPDSIEEKKEYKYGYQGFTKINHKPSCGNFWHVEIFVQPYQGNDKEKLNKIESYDVNREPNPQHWSTQIGIALAQHLRDLPKISKVDPSKVNSVLPKFFMK